MQFVNVGVRIQTQASCSRVWALYYATRTGFTICTSILHQVARLLCSCRAPSRAHTSLHSSYSTWVVSDLLRTKSYNLLGIAPNPKQVFPQILCCPFLVTYLCISGKIKYHLAYVGQSSCKDLCSGFKQPDFISRWEKTDMIELGSTDRSR